MPTALLDRVRSWGSAEARAYRSDTDEARPLGGYVEALGVYALTVGGLLAAGRATGRRAPVSIGPWDVALTGVATHKLARMISKDAVTTPLRAPFTVYEGPQGEGEVHEEVRHHGGPAHAVGELLTCPFCLAQWVATGFAAGSVFAPGLTRLVAATFASVAASDFLQLAYAAMERVADGEQ